MDQLSEGTAFALQEIINGTSFDEIRRLLVEHNYSSDEVNSIMKMADHLSMSIDYGSSQHKKRKEYIYLGIALLIAGIGVTIFSYFKAVERSSFYIITLGPIIAGIAIVRRNYKF
jgi:hypothetical protein